MILLVEYKFEIFEIDEYWWGFLGSRGKFLIFKEWVIVLSNLWFFVRVRWMFGMFNREAGYFFWFILGEIISLLRFIKLFIVIEFWFTWE